MQLSTDHLSKILLFAGYFISFVISELTIGPLLKKATKEIDTAPPSGLDSKLWQRVTTAVNQEGARSAGGKWIGRLELILFYIAVSIQKPELIAGWLIFKVGSKWETWTGIVKVPEKIEGIDDDVDYLRARHAWGSMKLTKFLVGTLAMVIYAFIGWGIAQIAIDLLITANL